VARKIIKQNSSFGVLRANPRISGNVKITVDSSNGLSLNSIDSNSKMSNSIFKGFRISSEGSYDKDLYRFFEDGKTPRDSVFGLIGEGEPVQNQTSDINQIYNFFYNAGVSPLVSTQYPEDFSYLAPIWLGDDIPDYFVIFKVNDPIDYSYLIPVTSLDTGKTYKVLQDASINKNDPGYLPFKVKVGSKFYSDGDVFTADQFTFSVVQGSGDVVLLDPLYNINYVENTSDHFYDKILPKSTVVSTFDLTENSNIGKYLRKIKSNPGYTDSLIDVRFENNQLTTFNGVDYTVGIFNKKGDFLLDYYETPDTQIAFEENITDGFKNNGIISYKLLNLEFLFNDNDSKNYTINRYFGLYVNAAEISKFKLDGESFFKSHGSSGNVPIPEKNNKGYYYDEVSYFQYNDNGIRLYIDKDQVSGIIPNSDTVNILEANKLFWIKDKAGNFHSLKRSVDYDISSPTPYHSTYGKGEYENQIVIQDTSVDLSLLTGRDRNTIKQYYGVNTGEKGRGYSVIRIASSIDSNGDNAFIFYNPFGYYGETGSRYDIIRCSDLSSMVDEWGPGSYYSQDNAYYYSPLGSNEDVIKALTGILNSFNYNSFEAFQSGDELVIRTRATGIQENNKYHLDFFYNIQTSQRMPESNRGSVFINDKDVCDINRRQSFLGGSNNYRSRVKIKIEDANKINVGDTFIETIKNTPTDSFSNTPESSNRGISRVIGKYRFVDQYSRDNNGEIVGLKDFETHATLELENPSESIAFGSSQTITAFDLYEIPLGIFSFYGLRELDMDFWESEYGYTPTDEYYKHLDTQPGGKTKIVPGKTYYVADKVNITYPLNGSPSFNIVGPSFFEGIAGEESYTLNSVSPTGTNESNVFPTLSSRGTLTTGIDVNNFDYTFYPDLDAFPGFYGIQAIKYIDSESAFQNKYDQLNFGKLNSEYDYTNDNYNPDYALKSRVSPYITKWVYKGGTDVRGNGYRLNSNIAFSPLNFSPSFFRRAQDPQYFTHEWYNLQRPPYSLPEENMYKDKSYLSGELDEDSLKDANPGIRDYFMDYFSLEGKDFLPYYPDSNTIRNIDLSERYTLFDFNTGSGFCETVFRGAKVRIKRKFVDYAQGESIKYIEDDRFYDNYKFSCVIVPIKNIPDKIQSPVSIKVIENRTFKNITFVVNVLIDDSRVFNFENISPDVQYLDLDYFLLYSLKDKMSSQYYPVSSSPSSLINGTIELPAVGDVKLSSTLNITPVPTPKGLVSMVGPGSLLGSGIIYSIPNPDYETDFREEINFTYLPTTSSFPVSGGTGSFYGIVGNPPYLYNLPYPTGVGEDFINFNQTDTGYNFGFADIGIPGPTNIPTIADYYTVSKIPVYQSKGGIEYWHNIFEKLSFANISLWINTGHPYVDYITCEWDKESKTTKILNDQFTLEFIRPSVISQNSLITSEEILDKPKELSVFKVGYKPVKIKGDSELYRYSGEYVPKFREILKFDNVKYDIPSWTTPESYTFFVKVGDKNESHTKYDIGSNNCFYIDGLPENNISMIKGVAYYFDISDPSNLGYQMYFSYNNKGDNLSTDNISQGYTLYGTPGTSGSYIRFEVPYDIGDTVYYVANGGNYMGGSIKMIDSIEYCYCSFGVDKKDFGIAKNVNYYKYSNEWIFRIGKSSPYNPLYNLIGETPVDRRNLSIFESSWDPGFYREYNSPNNYISLPGTKNMKEEKAFFGSKFMKTPGIINTQKQKVYPSSLSNVLNLNYNNYPEYEILWEETSTEIRGVLLIDRMLYKYFLNDGGEKTFREFIVPEFGFGSLSTVDDDFKEYIYKNIVNTFQSKNIGSYIKKIPTSPSQDLFPVIGDLPDYQKVINGYFVSSEVRYTKVNDLKYEFNIPKDPSFDYSISFSIQIGKI
jgi:hypothetical protein